MTRITKNLVQLLVTALLAIFSAPLAAQVYENNDAVQGGNLRNVTTQSWVEEWDPVTGQWVRVTDSVEQHDYSAITTSYITSYTNGVAHGEIREAARYAQPTYPRQPANILAYYGPFVVTSANEAAIIGSTDSASPAHFDAMLRDFPAIARLEMIEAPGTSHDIANLAVGRRIREAGISTHVPNGGSVRSGAVELFLAGTTRSMEDGAQFAVHSWLDNYGREADDFAANHPAHRLYLDYYVEMGMSEAQARDFYNMTNSVPHHSARWLDAGEMRDWVGPSNQVPAYHEPVQRPAQRFASAPRAPLSVTATGIAPLIGLDEIVIESAPAPSIVIEPMLDYTDLSGVNLAQLDLSGGYAP